MPVSLWTMMRQSRRRGRHTAEYRERERLSDEAFWVMLQSAKAVDADVFGEKIEGFAHEYPDHAMARVIAAAHYMKQERLADAFRHIAIALAVDPDNPVPHKMLAGILKRSGDDTAVPHIMEAGWRVYPAWGSKADIAKARESWFAGPSESEKAAMAEDIRYFKDPE